MSEIAPIHAAPVPRALAGDIAAAAPGQLKVIRRNGALTQFDSGKRCLKEDR